MSFEIFREQSDVCAVQLRDEINANVNITTVCESVRIDDGDQITITFEDEPSAGEITELDDVVLANHVCAESPEDDILTMIEDHVTLQQIIGADSELSEPMLFVVDTTRDNKELSVEKAPIFWAEAVVGHGDWLDLGNATNSNVGWMMPYDGTIVRATGETEDANNSTHIMQLYIENTNVGTVLTFSGFGEQQDYNTILNIDFDAGDELRMRSFRTSGSNDMGDTAIVLWIKWRTP